MVLRVTFHRLIRNLSVCSLPGQPPEPSPFVLPFLPPPADEASPGSQIVLEAITLSLLHVSGSPER